MDVAIVVSEAPGHIRGPGRSRVTLVSTLPEFQETIGEGDVFKGELLQSRLIAEEQLPEGGREGDRHLLFSIQAEPRQETTDELVALHQLWVLGLGDARVQDPAVTLDALVALAVRSPDQEGNHITLKLLLDESEEGTDATLPAADRIDAEWRVGVLQAGELRVAHRELLEELAEDRVSNEVFVILHAQLPEVVA